MTTPPNASLPAVLTPSVATQDRIDTGAMHEDLPLAPLFSPRSVAVFGASPDPDSVAGHVFKRLRSAGFEGRILPVNPKHTSVDGTPCLPDLSTVTDPIDLAIIATPAKTVPTILEGCARAGTRHAVILSSGFGEGGKPSGPLASRVREVAQHHGIRFLGPNCVGLARPWIGLDTTFLRAPVPQGRLAFVSQSGALCSAMADWAGPNGVGFSALVSLGNMLDLGFGETLRYLARDPQTDAILLYVETVRDAAEFLSALRLTTRTKPVIVLKAGTQASGRRAAQTHTGALMGDDAVFDAVLDRGGALRVRRLDQLFAAAEILASGQRSVGSKLAIVTNGGGAGILAADHAGELGIPLSVLTEKTLATLDARLPSYWSRGNPVDILGDAKPDDFSAALTACLDDPQVDAVLAILTPQAMSDATHAAEAVAAFKPGTKQNEKPILTCWMGQTSVTEARKLLSDAGLPDYDMPERAVEAFGWLDRHRRKRLLAQEVPAPRDMVAPPDIDAARKVIDEALVQKRTILSDSEAKRVLEAFAIPVTPTMLATSVSGAVAVARSLGYPVALKIAAEGISHKTEAGGVRLNLTKDAQVRSAFREVIEAAQQSNPEAHILGVCVEPMVRIPDAREVLLGASRDPVFGAVISFGAGGTLVELLADTAVALPPLNAVLARRMIAQTRVAPLLDDFRGMEAVNKDALIDTMLKLSDLVCALPEITGLDINPLFVSPLGVVAVDARMTVAPLPKGAARDAHLTIAPYPQWLDQRIELPNGQKAHIRPILPVDAKADDAFVRGLSPETRRCRFLGAMKALSPDMLARFTQIDYREEMALCAFLPDDGTERLQGVARYTILPDRRSAEFAIVVADAVQKRGLGTALMRLLLEAAKAHGIERIEGLEAAENPAMRALAARFGFSYETARDSEGALRLSLALPTLSVS